MALKTYRAKRRFTKTTEPEGVRSSASQWRFVVQKHAARHLHFDFRLEFGGVLKSWAVPKGPPLAVGDRRLAVHVEDHPLGYRTFQGRIPKGEYGAGTVKIWDQGTYEPLKGMQRGLKDGKIEVRLHGKKLKGDYVLVRMDGKIKNGWLMMRMKAKVKTRSNLKMDSSIRVKARMPEDVRPMLAELVEESFDREGWIFEPKWDGYRAIAEIRNGSVRFYSRNGQGFEKKFSEIVDDLRRLPFKAILDGEVVALNSRGRPEFQLLQEYEKYRKGQLMYQVFDLLYFEGHDLRSIPLLDRKSLLEKLVADLERVKYTPHDERKGRAYLRRMSQLGFEGIMAKRADSTYHSGARSSDWQKIKVLARQEAVIVGYTEPRGARKYLGALILGIYDNDELRYVGHTGGGSDDRLLRELENVLKKLERKTSPFAQPPKTNAPVHWVKPILVAEVKFQEWTREGIMRQPILLGLRADKIAPQVVRELPKAEGITHADKVFWPGEKITKGDLANYYLSISPYILPHLKDRPLSMKRFPDGIQGLSFFQKDQPKPPSWAKTIVVPSDSEEKSIRYLLCNDRRTLGYLAQLGAIELHPWLSRKKSLDKPDFMVIDLDPEAIGFDKVVKTARMVKDVLDELGAASFCKTSGSRGLHVCVPLGAKYSYQQSLLFAQLVASIAHERLPSITSLERSPAKRQRKVYLDCFQNRRGATLIVPYGVRPLRGAPVSTPLHWKEVKLGLDPKTFTIKTTSRRLARVGDLWKPVLGPGVNLSRILSK